MAGSHLQARSTKIYSNNRVYSPGGLLMFRCSDKKLNWYIHKNLAESIPSNLYLDLSYPSSTPKNGEEREENQENHRFSTVERGDEGRAIRLLFEPKGRGRNRVGDEWYLENQQDRCVVCGRAGFVSSDSTLSKRENTEEEEEGREEGIGLTLHHVVPYQYRREMPTSFKAHGSHDVLVLCTACHDRYERYADEEKMALVRRYDAPLGGRGWIKVPRHDKVRAAASALVRYKSSIPPARLVELRETVKGYYGLTRDEQLSEPVLMQALSLKSMIKGKEYRDHGQIVIDAVREQEGEQGFADFVRFWRRHFLDVTKPRFLSPRWSVDDPVNLVAGEYNPYRPEMDGS